MRRHLFWRIYLTLLASLALLALVGGGIWRMHDDRVGPTVEVAQRVLGALLPPLEAPATEHQAAIDRLARALDADIVMTMPDGSRIAAGNPVAERHGFGLTLADGRRLRAELPHMRWRPLWAGLGFLLLVALAVGIAAHPVVRRLTRRLERLRDGVDRWGAGDLARRVDASGRDEVAAVARSFNAAAARVESLLAAHKTLLANASHELRSPLARLRMAIEMGNDAEIERSFAELDQLIEEILLASRLDHAEQPVRREQVDLLALAAEEAARAGASADGQPVTITGDPVLLRRLLRNLFDNALKHGAPPVEAEVTALPGGAARIAVADRGPGIPAAARDRIFEPFFRPAGAAESGGSWGLGLSLVRRIAQRHGGEARCEPREGGGTRFVVELRAS